MNVQLSRSHAKNLFEAANTDHRCKKGVQVLDVAEFIAFARLLFKRPELDALFQEWVLVCGISDWNENNPFVTEISSSY